MDKIIVPEFGFIPIVEISGELFLPHGTVLRLPGKVPYESVVDFMIVESYNPERGMGLMVSSGYKAGLMLVVLPLESGEGSTSVDWLRKNWTYWVYPECSINDVYVTKGYPVPECLP